jgi:hypothetical protein
MIAELIAKYCYGVEAGQVWESRGDERLVLSFAWHGLHIIVHYRVVLGYNEGYGDWIWLTYFSAKNEWRKVNRTCPPSFKELF